MAVLPFRMCVQRTVHTRRQNGGAIAADTTNEATENVVLIELEKDVFLDNNATLGGAIFDKLVRGSAPVSRAAHTLRIRTGDGGFEAHHVQVERGGAGRRRVPGVFCHRECSRSSIHPCADAPCHPLQFDAKNDVFTLNSGVRLSPLPATAAATALRC